MDLEKELLNEKRKRLKRDRFKGNKDLIDQELLNEVTIVGLGGIGSPLVQQLAIMGFRRIVGYDFDNIEAHNLSSTIYPLAALDSNKNEAAKRIAMLHGCRDFVSMDRFEGDSEVSKVMMVCPDQIEPRVLAFNRWKEYIERLSTEDRKNSLFVDMRMGALTMEIITVHPFDTNSYLPTLPKENEVIEAGCTQKHTIFTGSIAAGFGVSQISGYLSGAGANTYVKISLWPVVGHDFGKWIFKEEYEHFCTEDRDRLDPDAGRSNLALHRTT